MKEDAYKSVLLNRENRVKATLMSSVGTLYLHVCPWKNTEEITVSSTNLKLRLYWVTSVMIHGLLNYILANWKKFKYDHVIASYAYIHNWMHQVTVGFLQNQLICHEHDISMHL